MNDENSIESPDGGLLSNLPHDEEPAIDQPDPNAPLPQVSAQDNEGDAIIVLKAGESGMHFGVRIATPQADTIGNPAHHLAEWLSVNFGWIGELANIDYRQKKAIHEAEERQRLRLVAVDGTPLGR